MYTTTRGKTELLHQGGTTRHPGRNVPELGAERPCLGRTWGGSTWGGSTEGRIDRKPSDPPTPRKSD